VDVVEMNVASLQREVLLLRQCVQRLHASDPLPTETICLFGDPNQLTNFRNFLSFAKLHIHSTQLGDYLVHTMTFLCHLKEFFLGLRRDRIL